MSSPPGWSLPTRTRLLTGRISIITESSSQSSTTLETSTSVISSVWSSRLAGGLVVWTFTGNLSLGKIQNNKKFCCPFPLKYVNFLASLRWKFNPNIILFIFLNLHLEDAATATSRTKLLGKRRLSGRISSSSGGSPRSTSSILVSHALSRHVMLSHVIHFNLKRVTPAAEETLGSWPGNTSLSSV